MITWLFILIMGIQQQCKQPLLPASLMKPLIHKKTCFVAKWMNISFIIFRCWISDAIVHQGVNIGYYAGVFIFTLTVFIITVRQIAVLKPAEAQNSSSIKTNSFSILGLFLLLGITWAFAFFSYGPLLLPSYYIFTILNSFQGRL